MKKELIPCLYLKDGQAVSGLENTKVWEDGDVVRIGKEYGNQGADSILVFDFSYDDASHEEAIGWIKKIADTAEIPIIGSGNIKRMEDVKKLIYAGCDKVLLDFQKESNVQVLEEVSQKFGKDKMLVFLTEKQQFDENQSLIHTYAGGIICQYAILDQIKSGTNLPVYLYAEHGKKEEFLQALKNDRADGICGCVIDTLADQVMELKQECKKEGIDVHTFESSISWSEFKLNEQGMVPVIVQDYKTDEVLMMAYMNEEAFQTTLETGKMTYWSRSRNELWMKGLTSGHYQYVKSLSIDCDKDTILAKVSQVGAACHTGNRSCFYTKLAEKPYNDTNPLRVFQEVYDVIADRKIHPKEGSYTNYLFDKGVDKILKKVGEECTEIVIAAKNPDKEEIKYEISDFLYHVMVLMVEKGVSWEDITRELARR